MPGEATILQILISIQAMIFCENPVENEPGMAGMAASTGSSNIHQGFNSNIRAMTAKFAILNWANNPPALWSDEVKYHLRNNGNKILQTVETWARDAQGRGSATRDRFPISMMDMHAVMEMRFDVAIVLPELQKALQRYGANYTPQRFAPTVSQKTPYGGGPFGRGGMYDERGGRGYGAGPGSSGRRYN